MRKIVITVVLLSVYCLIAGCNCPCKTKSSCVFPEDSVSMDFSAETAVVQ